MILFKFVFFLSFTIKFFICYFLVILGLIQISNTKKSTNPIPVIRAPTIKAAWYYITSSKPRLIRKSINGPDMIVQANPQERKKVVLYTPNNFALTLKGIRLDAMA